LSGGFCFSTSLICVDDVLAIDHTCAAFL